MLLFLLLAELDQLIAYLAFDLINMLKCWLQVLVLQLIIVGLHLPNSVHVSFIGAHRVLHSLVVHLHKVAHWLDFLVQLQTECQWCCKLTISWSSLILEVCSDSSFLHASRSSMLSAFCVSLFLMLMLPTLLRFDPPTILPSNTPSLQRDLVL